jgi:hypothetical protein
MRGCSQESSSLVKERFMIGKVIRDTYRIYDEIGRGSVATVYLAKDLEHNRVVALKVIHPELAEENQFARRFQREAKLLARLDSPHAIKVLDYGEEEGLAFIVLEYMEGRTLAAILEEERALEMEWALSLASGQSCGGLPEQRSRSPRVGQGWLRPVAQPQGSGGLHRPGVVQDGQRPRLGFRLHT